MKMKKNILFMACMLSVGSAMFAAEAEAVNLESIQLSKAEGFNTEPIQLTKDFAERATQKTWWQRATENLKNHWYDWRNGKSELKKLFEQHAADTGNIEASKIISGPKKISPDSNSFQKAITLNWTQKQQEQFKKLSTQGKKDLISAWEKKNTETLNKIRAQLEENYKKDHDKYYNGTNNSSSIVANINEYQENIPKYQERLKEYKTKLRETLDKIESENKKKIDRQRNGDKNLDNIELTKQNEIDNQLNADKGVAKRSIDTLNQYIGDAENYIKENNLTPEQKLALKITNLKNLHNAKKQAVIDAVNGSIELQVRSSTNRSTPPITQTLTTTAQPATETIL